MNGSFSEQEPGAPLAARPPVPVPTTQTVRVALPPLVPMATYIILGFTVFVYLMQMASVAVFGYAANQIDWLEVYGARFNSSNSRRGIMAVHYTCVPAWLDTTHLFQYVCAVVHRLVFGAALWTSQIRAVVFC